MPEAAASAAAGSPGSAADLRSHEAHHRHGAHRRSSQRYCGENGFEYVIPHTIEKDEEAKHTFISLMGYIDMLYKRLQDAGVPNEDARYILPNACTTCIEVKMNFRTLIHFMNERLCTRAQWEIRQMALLMKKTVEEQYPELAKYLVPKCEIHECMPFCTEHKSCGRHPLLKDIYSSYW